MLLKKVDKIFPEKFRKIQSDDQPWISFKLKKLDRKQKRVYRKERRSVKWHKLDKAFKKEVKQVKADFYKQKIAGKWYSALKRISSFDQIKTEQPVVDEINHLPDQEQAELIADQFASI